MRRVKTEGNHGGIIHFKVFRKSHFLKTENRTMSHCLPQQKKVESPCSVATSSTDLHFKERRSKFFRKSDNGKG